LQGCNRRAATVRSEEGVFDIGHGARSLGASNCVHNDRMLLTTNEGRPCYGSAPPDKNAWWHICTGGSHCRGNAEIIFAIALRTQNAGPAADATGARRRRWPGLRPKKDRRRTSLAPALLRSESQRRRNRKWFRRKPCADGQITLATAGQAKASRGPARVTKETRYANAYSTRPQQNPAARDERSGRNPPRADG